MSDRRRARIAVAGRVLFFLAGVAAFTVPTARAQTAPERGEGLGAPEPGVERPFAWPGRTEPSPIAPSPAEPPTSAPLASPEAPRLTAPRAELAYTFYRMADAYGQAPVHAFQFGGLFPTGVFRFGLRSEIGVRRVPLVKDDFLLRAALVAGYQHLPRAGRLVPYVAAVVSAGVLFGKRFHTPISEALGGGGIEAGADVRLVSRLSLGLALAYERASLGGRGRDLFQLRVRLGL